MVMLILKDKKLLQTLFMRYTSKGKYRVEGNVIEQTVSTYNQNSCNKVLIKISKDNLKQFWLALLKHLLILIIISPFMSYALNGQI